MPTTTEQLRKLLEFHLERSGLSQTALAKQLKVAPSAVSRILSGDRQISATEMFAIKEIFKVPLSEFEKIFSVGIRDDVEFLTASFYYESSEVFRNNKIVGHLLREKDHITCPDVFLNQFSGGFTEQIRWIEVLDDAMSPSLERGDIIFVDTRNLGGVGAYLLQIGEGLYLPRRLDAAVWEKEELIIRVFPDNPRYKEFKAPLTALTIRGRITGRMTAQV